MQFLYYSFFMFKIRNFRNFRPFWTSHVSEFSLVILETSLFSVPCRNCLPVRCVSVANLVYRDVDIVWKLTATLKQILQ
jgi:hypothetical protein